ERPKQSGQTIWNKPSPPQKQHTKHTRRLARRQLASSRINPKSGGPKSSLTPWLHYASGSPRGKTWGLIQPELAISSRRGGAAPSSFGISGAPNRSSDRVCALPRQQTNLLVNLFVRFHVPNYIILLLLLLRSLAPLGDWEMDRPLTPYELDVAIRDSSLGSAPGHDNMLNEFPHNPVPIAHGTPRMMIHNSFANGSLPGFWNTVETIPIPQPGKGPYRPVSYRPITLLSVLLNRKNDSPPSVSVIAAPPTSIRVHTFAFNIGRDDTCYR
ncbi:hypothetical protein TcCL_Unassigned04172, partial [Trypanosoma cruzi]